MDLTDKVILVTGAAHRLGREIAETLADRGARVAVHYGRSRVAAEQLAERLGGRAFQADLTEHAEVEALPGRVRGEMGRLDGLVNSAAVFRRGPFGETQEADWAFHMDVNLKAPYFLTQAFVAGLPDGADGRVVNLSDARGDVLDTNYPLYSLSKAGLQSLTRGLAMRLAPRVRVFGIVLGHMLPVVGEQPPRPPPPDSLIPGFAPAGTTGEAVAYLMGPGDFATGAVLYLDGGRHLRTPWGTDSEERS